MLTKQIFQGIKFNSISQPLCMVILFVRNVFLVRLLGIEDYGFYVIVVTSLLFLEPIFTLQTDRSLLRYLPEYNSETKLGKFKALVIFSLKWSLSSFILLSTLILFLIIFFFEQYLVLAVLGLLKILFTIIRLISLSTLLTLYQHKYKSIIKVSEAFISLILVLAVFPHFPTIVVAVMLLVFSNLYLACCYSYKVIFMLNKGQESLDKEIKKRFFQMSSRGIISRYTTYVVRQKSEVFFIAAYHSPTLVSIYSLGYDLSHKLSKIFNAPIGDLRLIAGSQLNKEKEDKMILFLNIINKYTCLFFFPAAITTAILGDIIISSLYGSDFIGASHTFRWILLLFSITIMTSHISPLTAILEKFDLAILISVISALINLLLDILLIPNYGINGAIIAVYSATLFSILFWTVFINKKIGYMFPVLDYLKIIISCLPMAILFYVNFSLDYFSFDSILGDFFILFLGSLTYPVMLKLVKIIKDEEFHYFSKVNSPLLLKVVSYIR
tara:strand:- start:6363 stop:7856 length:1494 start_codon:yes stop_codon:yes gene_type:complete